MDRTRKRGAEAFDPDAMQAAEELVEKRKPPHIAVSEPEASDPDVDTVDEVDAILSTFDQEPPESDSEGVDSVRKTGVQVNEVPEPHQTIEDMEAMTRVSDRVKTIDTINDELRKHGVRRRYALGDASIPKGSIEFEDEIGKYYYKTDSYRPSDLFGSVADYIKTDDEVLKTVASLINVYPLAMDDVAGTEQAGSFVDDVLVDEGDVAEDRDDAFGVSMVDSVGEVLENANLDNDTTQRTDG
jgi:hypothetical protein